AYFALDGTTLVNLCNRSTTAASTMTFPAVTGDTIYFWYARGTISDTNTNSVFVDGVQYNISQLAPYSTWLATVGNWVISLIRITGLQNTTHTVQIVIPASGAVNAIALACFNSKTIASNAPIVMTGNCLKMSAAGYALASNTANDPATSGNNAAITL